VQNSIIALAILDDVGELGGLMSSTNTPDSAPEAPGPAPKWEVVTEPDFDRPSKLVAEFVALPDFPACAVGEFLDIGGFEGVLVNIVNQSIKVKSPEGITQSFNIGRLRTLYGPVVRPAAVERVIMPDEPVRPVRPVKRVVEEPAPPREFIEDPDFDVPPVPIRELAVREDFPKCAYGVHVDINGFAGVVVEIVKQSVKVRSQEGFTQSYNAPGLRKLYGQP
jgi:hypothetical protein